MDEVKASLIMEFILRQPIEDWLAKEILLRLPTPALLHPHLKKTLLLRRLISDLASAPIRLSECILTSLEIIEELDRSLGVPHPHPALSAAYCAVAAELTVAPLRTAGSSEAEAEFLDAADRIWNVRVPDLERSEGRGLVSEGLREWRRKVEDALACEAARRRLPWRDTRGEAEKALSEYLTVAVDAMGPPILELVAAAVCGGAVAGRCDGDDLKGGSRDGEEPGISTRVGAVDPDGVAAATGTRVVLHVQEEEVPVGAEEIQKRTAEEPSGPDDSGGVMGVDVAGGSVEKDAQATATERTAVKGHQGGEQAEFVQNSRGEAPTGPIDPRHNQKQAHADMAGPSVEKGAQAASTMGHAIEGEGAEQRAKVPRTSLMERNPTARTYQWDDDSIETLSEKSADSPKRPHLSTPRVHRISPLKLYENTKQVRRRRSKRWTPQEEDALREAVQKYGVGNWKWILKNCPGAFEDRTVVDLKDKWRNMSRYNL